MRKGHKTSFFSDDVKDFAASCRQERATKSGHKIQSFPKNCIRLQQSVRSDCDLVDGIIICAMIYSICMLVLLSKRSRPFLTEYILCSVRSSGKGKTTLFTREPIAVQSFTLRTESLCSDRSSGKSHGT